MTAASLDDLFDQDWERIMQLDPSDPRVADPGAGQPGDDFGDPGDEGLGSVPPEVCEDFLSDPFTGAGETFAAGFLHHDGGRRGTGFAAGGILDEMDAGPLLARFVQEFGTDHRRMAGLGESELIGVLYAAERLISWASGQRAETLIALGLRRAAQSAELKNKHLLEHVDGEIAAALHISRRAATRLLDHSGLLRRLPDVRAAQLRGRITWEKAEIFGDELAGLTGEQAREIAARVLPGAEAMTPGELRRLLRLLVGQADPDAVRDRRKKARKDTAVHLWTEPSGNCGLAGRELDPALARAADARLTAQAQWLAQHGMHGTIDQLRAAAFLANQNGIPLAALLPAAGDSDQPDSNTPTGTSSTTSNADAPSGATGTAGTGTGTGSTAGGGKPGTTGPDSTTHDAKPSTTGPDSTGHASKPGPTGPDSTGQGSKPGPTGPDSTGQGSKPGSADPGAAEPDPSEPPCSPSDAVPITEVPPGPALTGIINLTMPISAYAYLTDRPGEIAGTGPADADTCRTLAQWMARDPATRWCLTLVDPDGRAVAHACAKTPPPTPETPPTSDTPPTTPSTPPTPDTPPAQGTPPAPNDPPAPDTPPAPKPPPARDVPPRPGGPPTPPSSAGPPGPGPGPDITTPAPAPGTSRAADLASRLTDWLTRLRPEFLERDPCTHHRQTRAYRPTRLLHHLITTRNRTCTEPGCTRPAQNCDLDHSIPYDKGGRTCECGLGPLCRHGHQAKQAPGWHLDQPEPGIMIWTMPSGRQYTTRPDPYPT
jgi:hypothetical protein